MNTNAAVHRDRTEELRPAQRLRTWWRIITGLLMALVFVEAIFAGAMLSGFDWARRAHAAGAALLMASTITAAVIALATLRHVANGQKLGLLLGALALALFAQAALGVLSGQGANLMWAHIPVGVALVGLAAQAGARAERLGA